MVEGMWRPHFCRDVADRQLVTSVFAVMCFEGGCAGGICEGRSKHSLMTCCCNGVVQQWPLTSLPPPLPQML